MATALKGLFAAMRFTADTMIVDTFDASGNTAWAAARQTVIGVDKKTGKSSTDSVQCLVIYERQANGKYLFRYWLETSKTPPKAGK